MESFDSTKISLTELLKSADKGKIQLPDFQRGWVWDDNHIKGILASVAKSFPIGAIMLLETGNETVRFKTKPVEGVKNAGGVKPDYLLLDGQQRLTSLYQAIVTNEVVRTRDERSYEINRWYYIDMRKAMDDSIDLEEAIISLNETKQKRANIGRDIIEDLSKPEYEYEKLMYPVCMIDEYSKWRSEFNKYHKYDSEKSAFWDAFEQKVINSFNYYNLPVIIMKKENPKEAVCQVFEKVNTGGVSLTVFELLTATFAAEDYDLKHDWATIKDQFSSFDLLDDVKNTDLMQAITLLSTYYRRQKRIIEGALPGELPAVSCKRKDVLNLKLSEYITYKDLIVSGYIKAAKILKSNHIYTSRDLPYNTQLIPFSAILSVLGDKIENIGNKNKIMQWFWCGVFGELYGSANETRYALDLPNVVEWIEKDGPVPMTVYDANFAPSRLHTLRTRNSAAYKGIYALLMDDNTQDWLSGIKIDFATYFSEAIDIHHIFPVAWSENNEINRKDYDCIINKTPLSARTNKIIGGHAPSKYLEKLQKEAGIDGISQKEILKTHVLNPEFMYKDDFPGFFSSRKEMILQRIEKAMNKTIPRDYVPQDEGEFIDTDNNGKTN